MTSRQALRKKIVAIAADSIGIAHFLVANLCIILGQYSFVFKEFSGKYPGLEFVYKFFDAPIALLFDALIQESYSDFLYAMGLAEIIIIFSSLLYAFIIYVILNVVLSIFMR